MPRGRKAFPSFTSFSCDQGRFMSGPLPISKPAFVTMRVVPHAARPGMTRRLPFAGSKCTQTFHQRGHARRRSKNGRARRMTPWLAGILNPFATSPGPMTNWHHYSQLCRRDLPRIPVSRLAWPGNPVLRSRFHLGIGCYDFLRRHPCMLI